MGAEYSIDELICVCIARQVGPGDAVVAGLAMPMAAAGLLLAQRAHEGSVYVACAVGQTVGQISPPLSLQEAERMWLESALDHTGYATGVLDFLPTFSGKEFFRPGQVDRQGNTNNISFGENHAQPRMRMPGAGGVPDVAAYLEHTYLYVPRHSRITFVEQVDFVSGLGHRGNGRGPRYLVSDLGQFDFHEGSMRLTHLHPGVSLERVAKKTGFDLSVAELVGETAPPSPGELEILRSQVDPLGIRRLELLSGTKRRRLLREIIEQENRR